MNLEIQATESNETLFLFTCFLIVQLDIQKSLIALNSDMNQNSKYTGKIQSFNCLHSQSVKNSYCINWQRHLEFFLHKLAEFRILTVHTGRVQNAHWL